MDLFRPIGESQAVLEPLQPAHEQLGRLVVQLLGDIPADPFPLASQQRHFGKLEVDDLGDPVQIIGDRLAGMRNLWARRAGRFRCRRWGWRQICWLLAAFQSVEQAMLVQRQLVRLQAV